MNKPRPVHTPMSQFTGSGNTLLINGRKLTDIADEMGAVAFDAPGAPIEQDAGFDTVIKAFVIVDPCRG